MDDEWFPWSVQVLVRYNTDFVPGRERLEDPVAMLRRYPVINDYWQDKRARIDQIQVPAYILASYSTLLHLPGSIRGFTDIPHAKKWYDEAYKIDRC